MALVLADAAHPDYGNLASLLLAMNEELGYHVREVVTVPGGFDVPDAVKAQLEPNFTPEVPAVAPSAEEKVPPAWWSEPEPEVNVTLEDGKYYADLGTSEPDPIDRELVRAWAKANGLEVADKGRLKQVVIDAYVATQAE